VNGAINQIVVAAITIASGPVFWGFVQWVMSRKGEKAKAAREQRAEEERTKQAEVDKAKLLADAQAVAQTTALASADKALATVTKQCDKCLEELHGLREIVGSMIDATEALMAQDTPQVRADVRATIRLARRAM
jgi:uncharacterized protein HemX